LIIFIAIGGYKIVINKAYRQGFRWPEEQTPPPLRKIAWNQVVAFGRSLCRDCCRRELAARNITDPDTIRKLTP